MCQEQSHLKPTGGSALPPKAELPLNLLSTQSLSLSSFSIGRWRAQRSSAFRSPRAKVAPLCLPSNIVFIDETGDPRSVSFRRPAPCVPPYGGATATASG